MTEAGNVQSSGDKGEWQAEIQHEGQLKKLDLDNSLTIAERIALDEMACRDYKCLTELIRTGQAPPLINIS